MKIFNLVCKIKKEKTEKRSGESSVNYICFNKIKFLKLLPSCKSLDPLQRSYLKVKIPNIFNLLKQGRGGILMFCFI